MIRVNLLPREEKAQRKQVSVDLKIGDVVLPLIVLAAAALVITGSALSQRTRQAGLEKSIQQVDSSRAHSRRRSPASTSSPRSAPSWTCAWASSRSWKKGAPRAFDSWTSWLGAFRTTSG